MTDLEPEECYRELRDAASIALQLANDIVNSTIVIMDDDGKKRDEWHQHAATLDALILDSRFQKAMTGVRLQLVVKDTTTQSILTHHARDIGREVRARYNCKEHGGYAPQCTKCAVEKAQAENAELRKKVDELENYLDDVPYPRDD